MVLVGEQYAPCLVIWHIVLLGLLTGVVIVLPVVDSFPFGNYFGCLQGIWYGMAGLGQGVWQS